MVAAHRDGYLPTLASMHFVVLQCFDRQIFRQSGRRDYFNCAVFGNLLRLIPAPLPYDYAKDDDSVCRLSIAALLHTGMAIFAGHFDEQK